MGVWIETIYKLLKILGYGVTPCMGVWIETRTPLLPLHSETSLNELVNGC